jgi:hypothetical protein
LSQCLAEADRAYQAHWNDTCAIQRLPKSCSLLAPVAGNLDQERRGYRDECYRLYPRH